MRGLVGNVCVKGLLVWMDGCLWIVVGFTNDLQRERERRKKRVEMMMPSIPSRSEVERWKGGKVDERVRG